MALLSDTVLRETYEPRIDTGIKLLDEKVPDWKNQIELGALDMSSCTECVLGQLYGHFSNGCRAIGINMEIDGWQYRFRDLGFAAGKFYYEPASSYSEEKEWGRHACGILTDCWKKKILAEFRKIKEPQPEGA